jgi:hypothetical protein
VKRAAAKVLSTMLSIDCKPKDMYTENLALGEAEGVVSFIGLTGKYAHEEWVVVPFEMRGQPARSRSKGVPERAKPATWAGTSSLKAAIHCRVVSPFSKE